MSGITWFVGSVLLIAGVLWLHQRRSWGWAYSGKLLLGVYIPWIVLFLIAAGLGGEWAAFGTASVVLVVYFILGWRRILRKPESDPLVWLGDLLGMGSNGLDVCAKSVFRAAQFFNPLLSDGSWGKTTFSGQKPPDLKVVPDPPEPPELTAEA